MTIGLMMVSFFSRRLFLSELMHEIYQTKFNRGTTPKVEKNYKNELTGNNKSMKSKQKKLGGGSERIPIQPESVEITSKAVFRSFANQNLINSNSIAESSNRQILKIPNLKQIGYHRNEDSLSSQFQTITIRDRLSDDCEGPNSSRLSAIEENEEGRRIQNNSMVAFQPFVDESI